MDPPMNLLYQMFIITVFQNLYHVRTQEFVVEFIMDI